jgi:hypothetical protein
MANFCCEHFEGFSKLMEIFERKEQSKTAIDDLHKLPESLCSYMADHRFCGRPFKNLSGTVGISGGNWRFSSRPGAVIGYHSANTNHTVDLQQHKRAN